MESNKKWKSLRKDFSRREIFDAFLGGLVFATLLYVPIAIALVEVVTVYMYLLTWMVIVIIISLFAYVYAIHYFWRKSLLLKKKEIETDVSALFMRSTLIVNAFVLIGGLIFLFVLIPILWV